jgi:hypothetical protein
MRLIVDPIPPSPLVEKDLGLVICLEDGQAPEIFVKEGLPKPDRHLLLGLMQTVAVAVSEKDPELVVFIDARSIVLRTESGSRPVRPGLVIARSEDGAVGVLVTPDTQQARVLARQALRWFTGTIRLDVP